MKIIDVISMKKNKRLETNAVVFFLSNPYNINPIFYLFFRVSTHFNNLIDNFIDFF